jgi:NADH:ubiquinone oxidoreductase subunit K
MTVDFTAVLFVASGLVAAGAFTVAWRRDLTVALGGLPVMLAGAGTAFVAVARFADRGNVPVLGQEVAVMLALVALASVALGVGIAGRESSR